MNEAARDGGPERTATALFEFAIIVALKTASSA